METRINVAAVMRALSCAGVVPSINDGNAKWKLGTAPAIKTCKARGNVTVLAKDYKGTMYPVTYANMTQANKRVAKLAEEGVSAEVIGFYPYLVRILEAA